MRRVLKEILTQQKEGEASPAIMGVCSYFANRFHLDVLAVRVATVGAAYLTSSSRAFLAYIAVGVILSISDEKAENRKNRKQKKTKIKAEIGAEQQGVRAGKSESDTKDLPKLSKSSVQSLNRKIKRLETRITLLEASVTSGHLKMARDFRDLSKRSEVPVN